MADTKVSALPATATPAGTDQFPINQAGASKRTTLTQIATFTWNAPVWAGGSAPAGSWPKLTVGTLLTTPEVGALELDANALYATTDAGNRGVVPVEYWIRLHANFALTSQTAAQKLFNSPVGGTLTLETGTYEFDGIVSISTMSATSGNAQFLLLGAGGATLANVIFFGIGADGAVNAAAALSGSTTQGANSSPASIVTAAVGTALQLWLKGTFEVTVAGTIIPSIALVTANAAVVLAGSYLKFKRVGATTMVSVGQWT